MTFSNGQFNPNPFANPFNTRIGPSNYSLNPAGTGVKPSFKPDPHVEIPDTSVNRIQGDVDQPAVPRLSEIQACVNSYPGAGEWRNEDIYRLDSPREQYAGDVRSAQYWSQVDEQPRPEVTELQKTLMAELENGTLVGKSRLVIDEET